MRVVILGSGAALPDPDRCHGSVLITVRGAQTPMEISLLMQPIPKPFPPTPFPPSKMSLHHNILCLVVP